MHLADLATVLLDCVEGGASVSFMAPFPKAAAEAFFDNAIQGVEQGDRILLAAFVDSQLVGTVQVVLATPRGGQNAPRAGHRNRKHSRTPLCPPRLDARGKHPQLRSVPRRAALRHHYLL